MPIGSSPASDPYLNRLLAQRYRLKKLLGQGGMGRVYLAEDLSLGKVAVAVKLLLTQVGLDEKSRIRFEREAKACAALGQKSLHIVRVNDYGITAEDIPFYVMEYLPGSTLERILEQGALSHARFFNLARQIGLGLKSAHEGILIDGQPIKIIHRDLKPANVLVTPDESLGELVKIVDFGIAKLLSDRGEVSVTHAYLGTLAYSSPEQLEGLPADPRSDLYSLGVILYQMISGGLPITPDTDTFAGWYQAHHKRRPVELDPTALSIFPQLADLIMACLAKDPRQRPNSAADVLAILEEIAPTRSPGSVRPPVPPPTPAPPHGDTFAIASPDLVQPPKAPQEPFWPGRGLPMVVGGFAAGICLAAGWLFILLPLQTPKPLRPITPNGQTPTPTPLYQPTPTPSQLPSPSPAPSPRPPATPRPTPTTRIADSPELKNPPISVRTFPVNTARESVQAELGSPQQSGAGTYPDTLVDRYFLQSGAIELRFIYDQPTLAVRQTEVVIGDQVSDAQVIGLVQSMLQTGSLSDEIRNQLQAVRAGIAAQESFTYETVRGLIQRTPQQQLYIGVWDASLINDGDPASQPAISPSLSPDPIPHSVAPQSLGLPFNPPTPVRGEALRRALERARRSK